MVKLNKNTQKAKQFIDNYKRANNNGELWQVYGKASIRKYRAMIYCEDIKEENNGILPKIASFNSQMFTYAFLTPDEKTLIYITPKNDYIIEL